MKKCYLTTNHDPGFLEMASKSSTFNMRVYQLVKMIPKGRVTTYGLIAAALGSKGARLVGNALNNCPDPEVPAHRVVNHKGILTGRLSFDHPDQMRDLLLKEKVEFVGEKVNLKKHLWQPPFTG